MPAAAGFRGPGRLDAFEADLRRLLADPSPAGRFSEHGPSTEAFVWGADAP
ncbi:hypothetical protein [Streptomyces sp. C11-1]|uniref:hypothetical protein n=1 Tax=Streptomyces sp. C11-1 TaxID=3444503 RepID=UPI0037DA30FF